VDGVRAYAAARHGAPLDLRSVTVDVHEWELRGWRGAAELDVTITCGGGTYIRALARDLGRLTSSAAHLSSLRRIRSGPFHVRDAVRVTDLRADVLLRSPLEGLTGISPVSVDSQDRARITRGQTIRATLPVPGEEESGTARAVLLDDAGAIVALAERQGDAWAPKVVLADA